MNDFFFLNFGVEFFGWTKLCTTFNHLHSPQWQFVFQLLYIYLVLGLNCCAGFLLLPWVGATLWLWCEDFSCWGAWALGYRGFSCFCPCAQYLWRLGLLAPWHAGTDRDQGWKLCILHWQANSYHWTTRGVPGFLFSFLILIFFFSCITWPVGFLFPNLGSDLCPCSGSQESQTTRPLGKSQMADFLIPSLDMAPSRYPVHTITDTPHFRLWRGQ